MGKKEQGFFAFCKKCTQKSGILADAASIELYKSLSDVWIIAAEDENPLSVSCADTSPQGRGFFVALQIIQ